MRLLFFLLSMLTVSPVFAQKMLLLERANRAKTTKMYIGETLRYRLAGEEDYWYKRSISDMLPEKNLLLLDNFPVQLSDISVLKVRRKGFWHTSGQILFTFGISLAFATTVAVLYKDKGTKFGGLYATSAGSLGLGYFLTTPRKLKMGDTHRLRLVEVKFPDPLIPPPPKH